MAEVWTLTIYIVLSAGNNMECLHLHQQPQVYPTVDACIAKADITMLSVGPQTHMMLPICAHSGEAQVAIAPMCPEMVPGS